MLRVRDPLTLSLLVLALALVTACDGEQAGAGEQEDDGIRTGGDVCSGARCSGRDLSGLETGGADFAGDPDAAGESDGTDSLSDASEAGTGGSDAGEDERPPIYADISVAEVVEPVPECEPVDPGYGVTEICDDGVDNNGNGSVDEGCACARGSTQPCFPGAPANRGVGGCVDGVQVCTGGTWGECTGGVLPSAEVCDDKDNDCDGCVDDDLFECVPILACPDEDFARPLSRYRLDASEIIGEGIGTSFEWTVVPPRNSATPGPLAPRSESTEVYLDVSGDYVVNLQFVDDKGATYGCSWVVHAQGDGVRVELVWDTFTRVDLDLHMHRSGTTTNWCTDDDCYYANCNVSGGYSMPSWGYAASPGDVCETSRATCPNPRLDIDNISGRDPENINIDNPNDGDTFRVMVHMFSGSAVTTPRVAIYCGGRLEALVDGATEGLTMRRSGSGCGGETWRVADVKTIVDAESGAMSCRVNLLTTDEGEWDIRVGDRSF
jgi:hypothetical protein